MRNYLVLFASVLPVLFVVISLIIEQQIPKPEDSPPLLISFDRYRDTKVPYTYDRNDASSVDFISSYKYFLEHASKPAKIFDLTTNETRICQNGQPTDIISYLGCIGRRSLLELSDQYLIGAHVEKNSSTKILSITGFFNNQPYHVPPLTVNFITNALLRQYSPTSMSNLSINVVNHPVS
jgi:ATP-binding cassette subfamily A (ABC1) protein 3